MWLLKWQNNMICYLVNQGRIVKLCSVCDRVLTYHFCLCAQDRTWCMWLQTRSPSPWVWPCTMTSYFGRTGRDRPLSGPTSPREPIVPPYRAVWTMSEIFWSSTPPDSLVSGSHYISNPNCTFWYAFSLYFHIHQ